MSARYMRCTGCGVVASEPFDHFHIEPGNGPFGWEPVEVWPEGTVAKLREVLRDCESALSYMTKEYNSGWYELPLVRAALAATEVEP